MKLPGDCTDCSVLYTTLHYTTVYIVHCIVQYSIVQCSHCTDCNLTHGAALGLAFTGHHSSLSLYKLCILYTVKCTVYNVHCTVNCSRQLADMPPPGCYSLALGPSPSSLFMNSLTHGHHLAQQGSRHRRRNLPKINCSRSIDRINTPFLRPTF